MPFHNTSHQRVEALAVDAHSRQVQPLFYSWKRSPPSVSLGLRGGIANKRSQANRFVLLAPVPPGE